MIRDFASIHRTDGARVLIVTLRRALRQISRCLTFEFEDVIAKIDRADVAGPVRSLVPNRIAYGVERVRQKVFGGRASAHGGAYELVFVPVENIEDLFHFGDLDQVLGEGRVRVCWLVEIWQRGLAAHSGALARLRGFDLIAVGCQGSVEGVQQAVGRPCFYLPPATDCAVFAPASADQVRSIDVYNMGRRAAATHGALLRLAAHRGWFYCYDTFRCNEVIEPAEHRLLLANTIKRTKFFIANKAKVDVPEQTGGQEEIGFRFFEGAAGGAVMLGERPRTAVFDELFGWPDAVFDLRFGDDDPAAVMDPLLADPPRMRAIAARNAAEAMVRHDWSHRWRTVLEAAGMAAPDALVARERRLGEQSVELGAVGKTR